MSNLTKLGRLILLRYFARGFFIYLILSGFTIRAVVGQDLPAVEDHVPVPTAPQLRWHGYERTMFIHYNPTTWTGTERDDLSLPLDRMNPVLLDTDQWCRVARSWGAKMILFVAKHSGGFCWWQTNTSDYGVKNIPWRDGKGDVLEDLSTSCRKYGLDLGVYVYPGDESWGAGIGSGGRTKDPSKQEAFNQVFRQQLTEVLTRYGTMREVWFDGSCVIDVTDILKKHAAEAVIFQGPMASIRWVGNESGIAPYPNWYTLKKEDLETGVATALHSDPDGDAYAPVEMDLPLLGNGGHKWFWAADTDHLLLSVDQLMDVYYKSVGRGGVMLLNATPDTTGLIPASHVAVYKAFGEEIERRFDDPVQSTAGTGHTFVMDFKKPVQINHAIIREELALGQRVRRYVLEGYASGEWKYIAEGSSVGSCKIDFFDQCTVQKVRLRVTESNALPTIREFSVHHVAGIADESSVTTGEQRITVGSWDAGTFSGVWKGIEIDLSSHINKIGQYQLEFRRISADYPTGDWGLEFSDWEIVMYGDTVPEAIEKQDDEWAFIITKSQQTAKTDHDPVVFRVKVRSRPGKTLGNIELVPIRFE